MAREVDPDTAAALADPTLAAAQVEAPKEEKKPAATGDNSGAEATSDRPDREDPAAAGDAAADADPDNTDKGGTGELDTSVWGSTGDETGDAVLLKLQESGIDPDVAKSLLYDAVRAGDPTKIDRDALVEKVGKVNANLILAGIENFVAKQSANVAATTALVYEAAGGEGNWRKVAEWTSKNVSDADRAEFAKLIDAGGRQAQFAAAELVKLYNADEKNTSVGTKVRIEGDGKAPEGGRAIGRRQYAEELMKAHRKGASPAVLKEIQAARERGRKRGL